MIEVSFQKSLTLNGKTNIRRIHQTNIYQITGSHKFTKVTILQMNENKNKHENQKALTLKKKSQKFGRVTEND